MKQHVARAIEVRDWIIAGDLERARASSEWLAEHAPTQEIPQEWVSLETDLRVGAGLLADASDLPHAASSLATVARACGACHAATGAEIRTAPGVPLPRIEQAGRVMTQHEWAAESLWQGLWLPSERDWVDGASAMKTVLHPRDIGELAPPDPRLVELETEVHELADRARDARGLTDRAWLYGEMIHTCSRCHSLVSEL